MWQDTGERPERLNAVITWPDSVPDSGAESLLLESFIWLEMLCLFVLCREAEV